MIGLVVMISSMVFFYRAAEMENIDGWKWATLSFVTWLAWPDMGLSILGSAIGQVVLFFAIAIWRALLEREPARRRR